MHHSQQTKIFYNKTLISCLSSQQTCHIHLCTQDTGQHPTHLQHFKLQCNTSSALLRISLIFISLQAKIFRTKMIQPSGMPPCHRTFSMPAAETAQISQDLTKILQFTKSACNSWNLMRKLLFHYFCVYYMYTQLLSSCLQVNPTFKMMWTGYSLA